MRDKDIDPRGRDAIHTVRELRESSKGMRRSATFNNNRHRIHRVHRSQLKNHWAICIPTNFVLMINERGRQTRNEAAQEIVKDHDDDHTRKLRPVK
jgi:hypothetical protein